MYCEVNETSAMRDFMVSFVALVIQKTVLYDHNLPFFP